MQGKANITEYLRSLVKANTLDSSKSFALVLSAIVGALTGVCVCFTLVWDVCTNGYVKTDLAQLGVFLLCAGGFMAGGGATKAIAEASRRKESPSSAPQQQEQPQGKAQ